MNIRMLWCVSWWRSIACWLVTRLGTFPMWRVVVCCWRTRLVRRMLMMMMVMIMMMFNSSCRSSSSTPAKTQLLTAGSPQTGSLSLCLCVCLSVCLSGVQHKVHQVQRKQIDSHKVCSKCPPLARTQARKHVRHWSTESSISDCSKPRHTCSRRCRSSSMSWTLVSYTRYWMTDHSARHVATELTRPQSDGLCYLVCHSAWCSV